MLRNYFKTALRTLRKRPGFTIINVLGLAVGIASCLLIGLWVQDELSYDDFHAGADRTYRVLKKFDMPNLKATIAHTPAGLQPVLETDYPQVETAIRVGTQSGVVEQGPQRAVESDVLFSDDGFFDVFSFSIRRGTARLDRPDTALLTPALVDKYFPNGNPIGQTVRYEGADLEVTGIVEAPPTNTHLDYTLVASLATLDVDASEWGENNWTTYVTLQPGTSSDAFSASLKEILRKNLALPAGVDTGDGALPQQFHLQPVTGIHLGVGAPSLEVGAGSGSLAYVYLFSALALFVLLLAGINFTNLATARGIERAKEVGVRKAVGGDRHQLAGQFLGESLLTTSLATILALGICALVVPAFNELAGKSIAQSALVTGPHLLAYVGLVLVVGSLSGSYPAFVLSRFAPSETLRSRATGGSGNSRLRQGLVVAQFAISITLIVATGVVHRQVSYMKSKGLGFDEKNVVAVDRIRTLTERSSGGTSLQDRLSTFKRELEEKTGIVEATSGYSLPGTFFVNSMWNLDRPDAEQHNFDYSYVGYDYVETLDVKMAAGRDFSRDFASDTAAVMVNEAGARELGLSPEEAIGEVLMQGDMPLNIIGVTENFHYESLHREINPLILLHERLRAPQYVAVRVEPGQMTAGLDAIRSTWAEFSNLPVEYSFLADDLAAEYQPETRLQQVVTSFAGLALFIACLGLLGLAAFVAQRRTKEIGIRKALGATVTGIVGLLSKDFLKLVGVAFVVAMPIAYVGLSHWLEDFAYRVELSPGVFLGAGAVAFGVAFLTVSYQAFRAARLDPTTTLRDE